MNQRLFQVLLLAPLALGLTTSALAQETDLRTPADKARLQAVVTFADNVLKQGRDRWSGQETPLFADGIDVDTGEPVKWVFNEEEFLVTNLANQQNLLRTLTGLSTLTGDNKYRQAAEETVRYHFEHLTDPGGLLRWGGHQFIDLATLQPVGKFDANCHELKNTFPDYELMWRVDPGATARYVRGFWQAHVIDWQRLDMNRHGRFGGTPATANLWDHDFKQAEPFFEGKGLTFINCGTDLIFAAGMLASLGEEEGAWQWSERLAQQYVQARHPQTGLGVYQYSKPRRDRELPKSGDLPTNSSYGDRAENQFGPEYGSVAREGWVLWGGRVQTIYGNSALVQLHLAERMGPQGETLLSWIADGLKAYLAHTYDPDKNHFRPMWADGTSMEGVKLPRSGYYGKKGAVIKPLKAGTPFLVSYARAFRLTGDDGLWQGVRSIAQGNGLGDLGAKAGTDPQVNLETKLASEEAIFALLEVHQVAPQEQYLELARRLADNLIAARLHHGYFLPSAKHVNARFSTTEPLAILALDATLRGTPDALPPYIPSSGYIHGRYDGHGRTTDQVIWSAKR